MSDEISVNEESARSLKWWIDGVIGSVCVPATNVAFQVAVSTTAIMNRAELRDD